VTDLVKKFSAFYGTRRFIPYSQDPIAGRKAGASNPQLPTLFLKIHSSIILPSTPKYSERSLPFRVSKNFALISHLSHLCYMPSQSHQSLLDHHNNILWNTLMKPMKCIGYRGSYLHANLRKYHLYYEKSFIFNFLVIMPQFPCPGGLLQVSRRYAPLFQ